MPIFDHRYLDSNNNPVPTALADLGAVLPVEVNIPKALHDLLNIKKQPVPKHVSGVALIDTGATKSCADDKVLIGLGIKPIGVVKIGTAKGATQCKLFPARLYFPSIRLNVNFSSMAGVNLKGQVIRGAPLIALVGRDVLSKCLLIYSGHQGYYTLTY